MPKTSYQKKRILALRDLLLEHTDENHPITIDELAKKLREERLEADKRTIDEDIIMLCEDYEMDISLPEKNFKREYAVLSREFTLQEVKVLLDCVQVSKFLSQKKTDELTKKIGKLCSKYERKQLQGQVHRSHVKSDNEGIYRFIDKIYEALSDEKSMPLAFQYFQYLPSKKKQYRNDGKQYLVYPFALVYADENYYLIAHDLTSDCFPTLETVKHYRVDRIDGLRVCESSELSEQAIRWVWHSRRIQKKLDIDNYTKQNFSMYGGKVERVTIQFPNHMAGVVIDRFGLDVYILKTDNEHFQITESIAVSPQFYGWIFGLGKEVKIIDPPQVAQGMKDLLKDTYSVYTVPRKRKKRVESD